MEYAGQHLVFTTAVRMSLYVKVSIKKNTLFHVRNATIDINIWLQQHQASTLNLIKSINTRKIVNLPD